MEVLCKSITLKIEPRSGSTATATATMHVAIHWAADSRLECDMSKRRKSKAQKTPTRNHAVCPNAADTMLQLILCSMAGKIRSQKRVDF